MWAMDWGYVAGFFDGEGCITFKSSGNGRHYHVTMYQNDRRPLERIQSFLTINEIESRLYDVNRPITKRNPNGGSRLDIGTAEGIYSFLWHIHDMLIVKQEAALAAMAHLESMRVKALRGELDNRAAWRYLNVGGG